MTLAGSIFRCNGTSGAGVMMYRLGAYPVLTKPLEDGRVTREHDKSAHILAVVNVTLRDEEAP